MSVALGAGAGCGKTTVLTERFLAEIEGADGRPLRALVALTFTDKAARELRQRIRARCRDRLAAGEDAARWRSVLRALEAAPIGTFHEFAGRLAPVPCRRDRHRPRVRDPRRRDRLLAPRPGHPHGTPANARRAQSPTSPSRPPITASARSARRWARLLATRTAGDLDSWCELEPQELVDRWTRVWEEQGRPAVLRGLVPMARCCRDLLLELEATHPKLQERRAELLDRLPVLERGTCSDPELDGDPRPGPRERPGSQGNLAVAGDQGSRQRCVRVIAQEDSMMCSRSSRSTRPSLWSRPGTA